MTLGITIPRIAPRRRAAAALLLAHAASTSALFASPAAAAGFSLPHENAVPGGLKILQLDSAGPSLPYVDADGHRALVLQDGWA